MVGGGRGEVGGWGWGSGREGGRKEAGWGRKGVEAGKTRLPPTPQVAKGLRWQLPPVWRGVVACGAAVPPACVVLGACPEHRSEKQQREKGGSHLASGSCDVSERLSAPGEQTRECGRKKEEPR